jgi:hypothetical protein
MALGLIILAASALSGISTAAGLSASRKQYKLDKAQYAYEAEAAQLAASEAAYESTRQFRQAIGSSIALAGARGGNLSFAQFTMESYGNYLRDQEAIKKRGQNAALAGKIKKIESKSQQMATSINLATNFGQSLFQNVNLNKLSKPKTGKLNG